MLTMSCWTLCRVAATTLSAGIVAMAVPAHAGAWVVDAKSGCQVWNPNPQLEELVAWSGSCANGRAEGPGVAQWSKDGSPSETDQGCQYAGQPVNASTSKMVLRFFVVGDPLNETACNRLTVQPLLVHFQTIADMVRHRRGRIGSQCPERDMKRFENFALQTDR